MGRQFLSSTIEDRVATVVFNHPPANALSSPVMAEIEDQFAELAGNDAVKAVVFTGAGSLFISGADIKEVAGITTEAMGRTLTANGQRILDRIEQMEKPVVAAINGLFCLGGGLELAMACHLRVAGERVRLGQPEIDLGIIPGFGGTQRLPRLVGQAKAIELILTGDKITAAEAKAIGLVNKVVPDAEVVKQAQGLAKKIASKSAVAVRAALRAIREGALKPLAEGQGLESALFGAVCASADKQEGLAAFIAKRQPKFEDR
ncbi:MAG: enoyl-CoA hydratase-related protein [Nitrospiria bacterium]